MPWNDDDPSALASLFTRDGVYQDLAFQQTWRGHRQIALWHSITHQGITGVRIKVTNAFRGGDHVAVQWTFSGTMRGAPASFTVPATTIMRLRHGRIVSDVDYYNRADLLKQSGLPADWTPPTS
ncbi:hypothetical protein GCM10022254_56150 [Actinomadura meridiana]|uniref:SnoaL-like domain-containing protein n=1 Tax=Actinomadura meridiana TaxID=559626 RepID=A0ABP8CFX1_9ACTN